MKKAALIFGFLVLTSQFSLCPAQLVSSDLRSRIEYGRQWTSLFLSAFGYGAAPVEPAGQVATRASASADLPEIAPMPPEVISMAAFTVPPVPSVDTPDITVTVDSVPPASREKINAQVQQDMCKMRAELQQAMRDLQVHRKDAAAHARALKALQKLEKIRVNVVTRSA